MEILVEIKIHPPHTRKMKFILLLFASVALLHGATTNRVFLTWNSDPSFDTNVTFKVYSQTNIALPLSGWLVLTQIDFITFTNQAKPGEFGRVEIPAAQNYLQFYVVTASNVFGESDFSDPVSARRLTPGSGLRIGAF